jgi:hypothetical protein
MCDTMPQARWAPPASESAMGRRTPQPQGTGGIPGPMAPWTTNAGEPPPHPLRKHTLYVHAAGLRGGSRCVGTHAQPRPAPRHGCVRAGHRPTPVQATPVCPALPHTYHHLHMLRHLCAIFISVLPVVHGAGDGGLLLGRCLPALCVSKATPPQAPNTQKRAHAQTTPGVGTLSAQAAPRPQTKQRCWQASKHLRFPTTARRQHGRRRTAPAHVTCTIPP